MCDLNLQDLDTWLRHSKVSHLDVETVEVDSIETLVDGLRKSWFTVGINAFGVVKGTSLVESSVEIVEFDI